MTSFSSTLIGALQKKKTQHAFVPMVMFPRHQNETSSIFLVAGPEEKGRVCFKKGVGINYPTQETCRTSGYCSGLVSILVMYWQTLRLIFLKPGVIEKQGPYWGPILKNCPLGMTDKLIMLKMVHSCAFSFTCVNFSNDIEHELKSCAQKIHSLGSDCLD